MYSNCLFCHSDLGRNPDLPTFPVGRRLAFDSGKGRLWVICDNCHRWNLSPLDERWEALEDLERLFRGTRQRFSTGEIGFAVAPSGLELVRIGPAERNELAAWRYGQVLRRLTSSGSRDPVVRWARRWTERATELADRAVRRIVSVEPGYDVATWLRLHGNRQRIVSLSVGDDGVPLIIRAGHIGGAELVRPEPGLPWQLRVRHDHGYTTLAGDTGLRVAGRLLTLLNGSGAEESVVRYALSKVEDAGNPDGYFARVAEIAMRTRWGRTPNAAAPAAADPADQSGAVRLALYLTKRSFWGRGGIGAEPATMLPRLPLVDRLALEIAANEDAERQALLGELAALEAAWREAETIAAIADGLFERRVTPADRWLGRLLPEAR